MQAVATPLRDGARRFVFADGNPAARVMIVGEAPGRDEDIEGLPFVGRAGQLLDRMLAAIGLARAVPDALAAVYITNVLPWRPPGNRTPEPPEIALFLPWLERHIALADPEVLVLMGNTPCQALLGRGAITRIRGQWTTALGKPVLPMFHPAYLLRNPERKARGLGRSAVVKGEVADMKLAALLIALAGPAAAQEGWVDYDLLMAQNADRVVVTTDADGRETRVSGYGRRGYRDLRGWQMRWHGHERGGRLFMGNCL